MTDEELSKHSTITKGKNWGDTFIEQSKYRSMFQKASEKGIRSLSPQELTEYMQERHKEIHRYSLIETDDEVRKN